MLDRNSEGRKRGRKDGLNEEEGDEYGGGEDTEVEMTRM